MLTMTAWSLDPASSLKGSRLYCKGGFLRWLQSRPNYDTSPPVENPAVSCQSYDNSSLDLGEMIWADQRGNVEPRLCPAVKKLNKRESRRLLISNVTSWFSTLLNEVSSVTSQVKTFPNTVTAVNHSIAMGLSQGKKHAGKACLQPT